MFNKTIYRDKLFFRNDIVHKKENECKGDKA